MSLLFALAFDHRDSLRRDFLRAEEEDAIACELKGIAFDGLLAAVADGLPEERPAMLVDEEYGADVIARAKEHDVALVVPVEVSGQSELRFVHGDDGFGPAIDRVDPTYVKVLVRYDPDGDSDLNKRQRVRLLRLQDWLDGHGRQLMLECLVPGPDSRRPDRKSSENTARAVRELVDDGLRPRFWKLEGQPDAAAFAEVAAATPPDSTCVVLGRGADRAAVERWLSTAAAVAGYGGFAVGRTLWWEPLWAFADDPTAARRAAAVEAIAANYRHLVDVYLGALTVAE